MLDRYAVHSEQGRRIPDFHNWFEHMHADRVNLRTEIVAMAERFLASIAELRQRLATEPEFVKLARDNVKASTLPRITQALLRTLIFRLDPSMVLTVNDALDIAHCIVPAAYADFVLLDQKWYEQIRQASVFLRGVGIETRIAERYTKRDVVRFLERLEAWLPVHTRASVEHARRE